MAFYQRIQLIPNGINTIITREFTKVTTRNGHDISLQLNYIIQKKIKFNSVDFKNDMIEKNVI